MYHCDGVTGGADGEDFYKCFFLLVIFFAFLPLLLLLWISLQFGASTYAQAQPANARSPQTSAASEVPPAVAQELQAVKARMEQMEFQLKDLAAFVAMPAVRSPHSAPTEVTLAGTVSCGHCQGIQPIHKGYTQFTWALNSVNQGDDIVLVSQNQVYKLQGNKDEILKFMSAKVRVTGNLDGSTLAVETIGRPVKGE